MDTQLEELKKLANDELEDIVLKGENLHNPTSKASMAQRLLEQRVQKEQAEAGKEILRTITFLRRNWFPNRQLWVKVAAFLFSTVILGIAINLASDWIGANILHWK